jgi:hypothetical protein
MIKGSVSTATSATPLTPPKANIGKRSNTATPNTKLSKLDFPDEYV